MCVSVCVCVRDHGNERRIKKSALWLLMHLCSVAITAQNSIVRWSKILKFMNSGYGHTQIWRGSGQMERTINWNIQIFVRRIDSSAEKVLLKGGIACVCGLILAGTIWSTSLCLCCWRVFIELSAFYCLRYVSHTAHFLLCLPNRQSISNEMHSIVFLRHLVRETILWP